jgi:hypothetical protein
MLSPAKAAPVIKSFFKQAEVNKTTYHYFTGLADKYLYDPNSPMRNEELYIPVLDEMLASPLLSKAEKIRPQDRRNLAEKNRPGYRAQDFGYTLQSGGTGTLYGVNAEYTLLFINNPGCHACRETIEALKQAPNINRYEAGGRLKILSVYPDEDQGEWLKYIDEFPQNWIRAYDRNLHIKTKSLYDLKAIPTLYLLDRQKKVLLKDTTVPVIEQYLQRQ